MTENVALYIGIYLFVVSLWAIWLTLRDKRAARRGKWRVKERTLLIVSVIGGSVAMLVTMHCARHKTQHAKFMVGIPMIIVFQIAAVIIVWWFMKDYQ